MRTKSSRSPKGPGKPTGGTDQDWLRANSAMITRKYSRQWIAVYRQSVIASGSNPETVTHNARLIAGKESFMMKHIEKGILII